MLKTGKLCGIALSSLLCACTGVNAPTIEPPTPTPVVVTQLVVLTAKPEIVQVTRVATMVVEQERVVTPTPVHRPEQACWDQAMTQLAMNGCANGDRDLALAELDAIVQRLPLEGQDRADFDRLQGAWLVQVQESCSFLYGRVVTDDQGGLHYERGSMAPMLRAICETEQIWNRIDELTLAYLTPDM